MPRAGDPEEPEARVPPLPAGCRLPRPPPRPRQPFVHNRTATGWVARATVDLCPTAIEAFKTLMLAQAQRCRLLRARGAGRPAAEAPLLDRRPARALLPRRPRRLPRAAARGPLAAALSRGRRVEHVALRGPEPVPRGGGAHGGLRVRRAGRAPDRRRRAHKARRRRLHPPARRQRGAARRVPCGVGARRRRVPAGGGRQREHLPRGGATAGEPAAARPAQHRQARARPRRRRRAVEAVGRPLHARRPQGRGAAPRGVRPGRTRAARRGRRRGDAADRGGRGRPTRSRSPLGARGGRTDRIVRRRHGRRRRRWW